MKPKDIILSAMKRAEHERGLRISKPNGILAEGHIRKADHNLVVMTDLGKMGHEDWIVIAAYYAMYQSALALLAEIGLESKEHATTATVLEYFFGEHLSREMISAFNEMKGRLYAVTIGERYIDCLWKIKRDREAVQYRISIGYDETAAAMSNARDFVTKIKLVISELDEKLVAIIGRQVMQLKSLAAG